MNIGGLCTFSKRYPNEPKCVSIASYLTTKHLSYLILISLSLSLFSIWCIHCNTFRFVWVSFGECTQTSYVHVLYTHLLLPTLTAVVLIRHFKYINITCESYCFHFLRDIVKNAQSSLINSSFRITTAGSERKINIDALCEPNFAELHPSAVNFVYFQGW